MVCDICNGEYKEKTEKRFRCEICDFDVCIKCKILEESGYKFNNVFLSKNHQHLLNLGNSSGLFGWNCDICDFDCKCELLEIVRNVKYVVVYLF